MLAALMALRTAAGTVSCGGSGIITEGYLVDLNTIPEMNHKELLTDHKLDLPYDTVRAGLILDALSYEGYKTVLPLYYGQTISQKGLRDENSIEMLEIINETRRSEPGMIFGITTNLVNSLTTTIQTAAGDAASVMASNKETVEGYIEELVEAFK